MWSTDQRGPATGGKGRTIAGDVLDADAVQRAVTAAEGLRIAVTCAGVATPGRLLGRDGPLALDAFERVLRINTVGTLNVLRLAAAAIAEGEPVDGERGVLITTASIAAFEGQIGQAAYAASKGAVAALTLPLARELWTEAAGDSLRKVEIPTLVLIGRRDVQIDAVADGPPLEQAAAGKDNVTFAYPANANHVVKEDTRLPAEVAAAPGNGYNEDGTHLDPEALDLIIGWLRRVLG